MPVQIREINQTISTRFDPDMLSRLDEIAERQHRSRSELIKEAVGGYLDSMLWFEHEVQKGLDDLEAGRIISHEDLKAELRKLGVTC
ncbi:MAG: ribbon-helix-helix protein, CopG family [Deltaproteobacteria bacterium]|nr:ribbon-helix-helix protein, CopG family [Deltaproteobacteria bacterium]